MDLYIIQPKSGAPFFRGTRADAKSAARDFGGMWEPVVVPDRKENRIAWLNAFAGELVRQHTPCSHAIPAHVGSPAPCPEKVGRDMSATAIISRMDGPAGIDAMVEAISSSSGHSLKRFAGAVATAFQRLAT